MEITSEKRENHVIVSVKGRVDAITSPAFEKNLFGLIEEGESTLLLNLTGLEYISSAGLRSILTTAKQLKPKSGRLLFAGLQSPVEEVFKISGFGSLFKIYETVEEASKTL